MSHLFIDIGHFLSHMILFNLYKANRIILYTSNKYISVFLFPAR